MPLAGSPLGLGLGSLGSILGGVGQGAVQADVLGQHQRALDLTERAQNLANPDTTALFKALGLDVPGGTGTIPAAITDKVLPLLEARRVLKDQQMAGQQAGAVIGNAAGTDPRLKALSQVLGFNLNPSDRALVQDYLAPKPPVIVPSGATAISQTGTPMFTPPPPQAPGPAPFGYTHDPKFDPTGRPSYGAPKPMNAMEHFNASQDASLPVDVRQRHYDAANYGRVVPWTEGGGVTGAANVATGGNAIPGYPRPGTPPPIGAPPAPMPGQPTLGRGTLTGPPKPPAPEQQDKLASYDTALTNLKTLREMAADPEIQQMLGSLGTNPMGALNRRAEEGVNLPLLGQINMSTLTPKQREFIGLMASTRTAALRSQEGLRPNVQFQNLLAPALSSLSDPGILDKLNALEKFMATNRESLRYEIGAANRSASPPPASATAPNPTPAQTKGAPEQWGRDANGQLKRLQ